MHIYGSLVIDKSLGFCVGVMSSSEDGTVLSSRRGGGEEVAHPTSHACKHFSVVVYCNQGPASYIVAFVFARFETGPVGEHFAPESLVRLEARVPAPKLRIFKTETLRSPRTKFRLELKSKG